MTLKQGVKKTLFSFWGEKRKKALAHISLKCGAANTASGNLKPATAQSLRTKQRYKHPCLLQKQLHSAFTVFFSFRSCHLMRPTKLALPPTNSVTHSSYQNHPRLHQHHWLHGEKSQHLSISSLTAMLKRVRKLKSLSQASFHSSDNMLALLRIKISA